MLFLLGHKDRSNLHNIRGKKNWSVNRIKCYVKQQQIYCGVRCYNESLIRLNFHGENNFSTSFTNYLLDYLLFTLWFIIENIFCSFIFFFFFFFTLSILFVCSFFCVVFHHLFPLCNALNDRNIIRESFSFLFIKVFFFIFHCVF